MITEYNSPKSVDSNECVACVLKLRYSKGVDELVQQSDFRLIVDLIALAKHHWPSKFVTDEIQFWELSYYSESGAMMLTGEHGTQGKKLAFNGRMPLVNVTSVSLYYYKNILMLPSEYE